MATSERRKAYIRKWLHDNREAHLAQQKQWRADNAESRRVYEKNRREELRKRLLEHYGAVCSCCGESEQSFLCIDHIDGGGEAHRKEVGFGTKFQWWLVKNEFPLGFQTLCHNCNQCIWARGRCAHKGTSTKTGGPRYEYMKELRRKVRIQVILHYGDGKAECRCCGENQFEFLCLDHLDGGGKQHQQSVGRGSSFYRWIVKAGFPSGFQVLCQNCNFGKGSGKECPHRVTARALPPRPGGPSSCGRTGRRASEAWRACGR